MGFHCRIKVEFFRYDLRKFTFIFWGIEKEEKHNKKKRKAKLLMGFICFSPKESSLYGTTRGVPLVRVLSLPYIIDLKKLPLLRRPISGRFIRWMGGWMDK